MPVRRPPAVPSWALHRPRLLGLLDSASTSLIVIRAGAGYGKTVLASQWAQTRGGVSWWQPGDEAPRWDPATCDLIVDDYRPGVEETDRLLLELLETCPPERRLLLLSRAEPSINLGRRRIEGNVIELGAADLALTSRETAALLANAGEDESRVDELMERTLGWPAAVSLALRSSAAYDDPGGQLSAYIESEIWAPLDDRERDFALETAVLDELWPDWCDLLTGGDGSARLLRQLRAGESWLMPPLKVGEGFRHHPLVREYLLSRLEETGRRRELERAAARVLKNNHRTVEAVSHALAAEDWELAIECLRLGADRAFREGNGDLLRTHLAAFPGGYRNRPELLRVEGYLLWAVGELEVAQVKARAAYNVAEGDLKADALILQAAVCYSQGDFDGERRALEAALALKPSERFISGKAWYGLGSLHYRAGRFAEAEEALLQAAALTHEGEPIHVAVTSILALLPLARGAPRSAISGLIRAIESNRRLKNQRGEAHANYHLAIALNQAGMHQRALNTLAEAEQMCHELGLAHLGALVAREAADAHRDLGSDDARERYRLSIAELESLNASAGLLHAYHGLSVLHRRRGEIDAARRAARKALAHESSGEPAFVSLVRLHQVLLDDRRRSVDERLEQALAQQHLYYRAVAHLYGMACDPTSAQHLAKGALALIQDEGLEHLLREEADLLPPWLGHERENPPLTDERAQRRPFRLRLLGGASVEGPDGETLRIRPLALRLLAYLALRRGATVHSEHLIDALWPDRGQEMRPTMQTLVWLLRRNLHERVVVSHSSGYEFDPDGLVWTDAEEFGRALGQGRLQEAAQLYQGELLPGVEWADLERRHFENRYLHALEELADAHYRQERVNEATELLEKIIQLDPYAEETYRKLIHWHEQAGHEDSARRLSREFAQRLERELGLQAH